MPRNGSGTYQLPSGNPVVTGTIISSSGWGNPTMNDLAAALTQSLSKDGQTTPTANLPMGNFNFTGLGAPTGVGQALRWEQIVKGSDIASAATITIPNEGSAFNVTGTTTITAINDAFPGRLVQLEFTGALTLTNSSGLVMPFSQNITTQAGDIFEFINDSTGVWKCIRLPARISPGRLLAVRTFQAAGTSTYTPTDGTRCVVVEVQGGGGAGGGTPVTGAGQAAVGGGGGAGGYASSFLASGFSGVTITVGAGGTAAGAASGGPGGTSSFGALLSATGGGGGPGGSSTVTPPWVTGGGSGGAGTGGNIINRIGGTGGSSFALSTGSALQGGVGGYSFSGGAGGAISGGNAAGNAAGIWGTGGGGVAMGQGQASVGGGAGFRGIVIVWEYA